MRKGCTLLRFTGCGHFRALAGETTVVWDRLTGEPLHNAIVWLDNRTAGICHALTEQLGSQDYFRPGGGRACGG